jgi:hypothetical protein
MQRLGVSGAVRPIYGSLGAKGVGVRRPLFQRFFVHEISGFRRGTNETLTLLRCYTACWVVVYRYLGNGCLQFQDCLMRPIDCPETSGTQLNNTLNVEKSPTNALILNDLLFHTVSPTCFGTYVPSSGISPVPAELQSHLGLWLIKFCVVDGCVFTVWRSGATQ